LPSLDPQIEQQVLAKLTQLQVNREAQHRFEASFLEQVTLPEGVLIDDPLPADPPELIDGILLTFGATGIIGEKEVGKSLVALELQHSLLTGEPLWGQIHPNKVLNKTVHFLAEHASRGLMDLYARTGMSKTGKLRVFGPEHLQSMKLLVSGGQRREEAVSFYKKLAEGAGLVVFDPLAAFIQGESAENDNSPMRNLIDTMIEIGSSTGAACLILGHQGKPQMFQGREMKRASYATRGASATEDAMAAVHYLDKMPNAEYNGNPLFKLRPVHYKGFRKPAFNLVRDRKTCRHFLDPKSIKKFNLTDAEDED
jgi:RecA-family ATPase